MSLTVIPQRIPDVRLIQPTPHADERGIFVETYNARALALIGLEDVFVQDNLSLSHKAGTVRGLHFQTAPHGQAKLVRCARGRILDVAVDLRAGSASFGEHIAVELSAEVGAQLYIPNGFAHGFCTLEPDCEVAYKVTHAYAPDHDGGVLWCDPALGINWPVSANKAILSARDKALPLLADLRSDSLVRM